MSPTPWEQLLKSVAHPLDWVGLAIGAASGLGVSVSAGGTDLGASAAVGASLGVAATKAARRAAQGPRLRRRLRGLTSTIREFERDDLMRDLERERMLWETGSIDGDQLEEALDGLVAELRKTPTVEANSEPESLPESDQESPLLEATGTSANA